MTDLFISYSRRDKAFVEDLHAALESHGQEVWVDWTDIPYTADWYERISEGIRDAQAFVFIVSADSVASEVCRREAMHAAELHKRIIGIQLGDIGHATAPEAVGRVNWIPAEGRSVADVAVELVGALTADLDWVKAHTRYLGDAERWDRGGRDASLLLRGAELQAAERWLTRGGAEQKDPPPAPLHYEFILAGRRGSTRRLRMVAALSLGAVVITAALAVLALTQRNQARDQRTTAQSRELSAASLLNLGDDPELSVLLAQRAAGVRGTDQARDALRQSLLASRVRASFNGHTGAIEDLDLSPDGTLAATTSEDGTLRTWEVPSGKPVATIREPKGFALVQVHFSPDGTMVGAATDGATVHVWDPRTGAPVATLVDPRDYRPQTWEWSPDSVRIVQSAFVADARIWDVRTEQPVVDLPQTAFADGFAWSADGSLIAFAGQGGDAALYDPATGRRLITLTGHSADTVVSSPVWSPDGQRLATTGFDSVTFTGETIIWSREGALLQKIAETHGVNDLAWSPDGTRLAGAGNDGSGRIWDASSGSVDAVLSGHEGPVNVITWIGDDELATGSEDESVRLWDAASGGQIADLRGHRGEVRALAVPPGGKLVLSASADRTVREWSAARDVIPRTGPSLADTTGATAISGDGHWMLALGDAGADAPTPMLVDLTGTEKSVPAAVPDGLVLIAGIDDAGRLGVARAASPADPAQQQDPAAFVVDLRSGTRLARLSGTRLAPLIAAFDPDGGLVAVGTDNISADPARSDGQVRIFDVASGRVVGGYEHDRPGTNGYGTVRGFDWSDDGSMLASGADDWTIRVWDVRGKRIVHTLDLPRPTARMPQGAPVDISPDGRWVAGAAGFDDKAYVWNLESGKEVAELAGHASIIESVRFHPDSELLVTASFDRTARIWDRVTGHTVAVIRPRARATPAQPANLASASFSADGTELLLASDTLDRYRCEVCGALPSLVKLARGRVTRNLTVAERAAYLHETS